MGKLSFECMSDFDCRVKLPICLSFNTTIRVAIICKVGHIIRYSSYRTFQYIVSEQRRYCGAVFVDGLQNCNTNKQSMDRQSEIVLYEPRNNHNLKGNLCRGWNSICD